jgi:cytochrome c oxidase subunit 3
MPDPSPFSDRHARLAAGRFGMWLFLASLAVLFAACVTGYAVIWWQARAQGMQKVPPLPVGLWLSTVLLVASSATIQWALHSARRGRQSHLQLGLVATTGLGFGFLATQMYCWIAWAGPLAATLTDLQKLYLLTSFYVLTGIHALHVIGGLIPLVIVTARAVRGRYTADHHPGVQYCTTYWHFLDGMWVILFVTLMIGTSV